MSIYRYFIFFIFSSAVLFIEDCGRHSAPVSQAQNNVAEAVLRPVVVLKPTPVTQVVTPTKPLQANLPVFHLVGIAMGSNGNYALVEDGTGAGYTVRVGSQLGQTGKIVKSIGADDLILMEGSQLDRLRLGE